MNCGQKLERVREERLAGLQQARHLIGNRLVGGGGGDERGGAIEHAVLGLGAPQPPRDAPRARQGASASRRRREIRFRRKRVTDAEERDCDAAWPQRSRSSSENVDLHGCRVGEIDARLVELRERVAEAPENGSSSAGVSAIV